MGFKKYVSEQQEYGKIEIELRDPDNNLFNMLEYIKTAANVGHSFVVVVDPDIKDHKTFSIDGDGSFYIKNVKFKGTKD